MPTHILDTRTGQIKGLSPIVKGHVDMYVCGPTVYSSPHIGHVRNYVFFDTLAKYLKFRGLEVRYVQNITDIGKNIKRVADENRATLNEIVEKYEKEYLDAMQIMNIDSVDIYERSSDNIIAIISQINRILHKKHGYLVKNGVFYDTARPIGFGAITHVERGDLPPVEEYAGKRSTQDFSLWKEDMSWGIEVNSPFGKGRPHWHVLDTALAEKHFGRCVYDIHGAGMDCIYPHHESIRAILKSLSGADEPVNHWIHIAPVNLNGQKMSKSTDNYECLSSLIGEYTPSEIRLYLLSENFTVPIEFNRRDLFFWKQRMGPIMDAAQKLEIFGIKDTYGDYGEFTPYISSLIKDMDDNINTPKVISEFESLSKHINERIRAADFVLESGERAARVFSIYDNVLGLDVMRRGVAYGKR